jgi:putative DNA primase/helicase
MDVESILAALLSHNAVHCEPLLPEVEVRQIAESVARYQPAVPQIVWTEDDLTVKLTEEFPQLRYVDDWKRWLYYEAGVWRKDNTRSVFDRAKKICRAASEGIDPRDAAALKSLRSAKTRAAVEHMARENSLYAAVPEQWDSNLMALNTPGGTCNLHTCELREHRLQDYCTKATSVAPKKADCPLWMSFMTRITGADAELQCYLQRVAGYCLTGITTEHILFFLYGTGANGKSTFTNTLLGLWSDYAQTAAMETFTENRNDRHPTELAALRGARLVVASETEAGKRWAESRIKALTGGEPIRAHFMHCDEFEFIPAFKLMIQGNHKPALHSVDEAIRRRVHLIPFTVTIPPEERDRKLAEKLRAEWPQILQWAIDGCLAWQREGLNPPAAVRDATEEYFAAEDAILSWIEERCIISPQAGTTKTSALYQDFKNWADRTGEFCGSQKRFSQNLKNRGLVIRESHGKVIDGIALRSEPKRDSGDLRPLQPLPIWHV